MAEVTVYDPSLPPCFQPRCNALCRFACRQLSCPGFYLLDYFSIISERDASLRHPVTGGHLPAPHRSAVQRSARRQGMWCLPSQRTLLAPPSPFKSNFHTQHNTEPHKPRQKLRISRPSSDYEADSPVFLHTCPADSFFWSGVRRTIRLGEHSCTGTVPPTTPAHSLVH